MKVTQIKMTDSSIQISANVSFIFIAQREGQERAIVSVDVKRHVYLLADSSSCALKGQPFVFT